MAKKARGKEKQAEEKKTAGIPKEEAKNVSGPIPVPAAVQVQKQVDIVREEEPEQDNNMTPMGQWLCHDQQPREQEPR